jgi:hypothetical protein
MFVLLKLLQLIYAIIAGNLDESLGHRSNYMFFNTDLYSVLCLCGFFSQTCAFILTIRLW